MENNYLGHALNTISDYILGRKVITKRLEAKLYGNIEENGDGELRAVSTRKFEWADSLLHRAIIYIDKGYIFKEFKDIFFMFYTNGTLIDEKTAKRL